MSTDASIRLTASDETQAAFRAVNNAFANVSSQANQMRDKAVSAFKGIAIAAAGLGTVTTMAGFLDGMNKSIEAMGELKDAAERTGASVENLSALKGVAKIGGRDFGMIEEAIGKLNKALHGTDDESKGAGKALAALGLDLQKMRAMDPAEAMLELAKAQEKFADGGGKSAAMMAIIKGSGAALIPYLHDLAEQQQLIGKVQTQQAKDADEYAKNVKKLEASWGNLSRQMGAVVVGPAKDITDWMLKAQKDGGSLQAVLVGIGAAMSKAFGGEINPLKMAEKDSTDAFNRVASIKKAMADTQAEIDNNMGGLLGKGISKLRLSSLKDDLAKAESDLKSSTRRLKKLATESVVADQPKDASLNPQNFGKDPSEKGGSKVDEAAALIARLNEKIGVMQLDLQLTDKMTDAEREAMTTMVKLRDGTLEATDAQKQSLSTRLQSLLVLDKEVAAHHAYLKALDDQVEANKKDRATLEATLATTQKAIDNYGLSEVQISANIKARLEEAIAMAEQNGASEEQIAYLKQELALREKLTDALDTLDTKRLMSDTDTGKAAAQHAKIDELRRKMQEGKISETEYDEAVNGLVNKTTDALSAMDEFAKSAAHNMESALADFFINPTQKGFGSLAASFGQTVQKMIAEAASAQIMKSLLGNMGQASGGQAGNWGWVGQAATFAAAFFADGGIMTAKGPVPLKKYANGGIANTPQLAMFGEGRMPEAYVPLPDGRNIPVRMQGGGGGSPNITVHVNSQTGDSAEIRRSAAAGARAALGIMSGARRYG